MPGLTIVTALPGCDIIIQYYLTGIQFIQSKNYWFHAIVTSLEKALLKIFICIFIAYTCNIKVYLCMIFTRC